MQARCRPSIVRNDIKEPENEPTLVATQSPVRRPCGCPPARTGMPRGAPRQHPRHAPAAAHSRHSGCTRAPPRHPGAHPVHPGAASCARAPQEGSDGAPGLPRATTGWPGAPGHTGNTPGYPGGSHGVAWQATVVAVASALIACQASLWLPSGYNVKKGGRGRHHVFENLHFCGSLRPTSLI